MLPLFLKLKQMGRKQIHDEQVSYFEKYGNVSSTYDNRRKQSPQYIYDVYVREGHYKSMCPIRMRTLLKSIRGMMSEIKRNNIDRILKEIQ